MNLSVSIYRRDGRLKCPVSFILFTMLAVFSLGRESKAQPASLRNTISQIVKGIDGTIGVAISGSEDHDTLTFNGNSSFPTLSVYKFPLAIVVLDQVDKGKLLLDQDIYVSKTDLLPDTWSPLREEYPLGDINIPLRKILKYTVSYGDNNGCDILFKLIGGPNQADSYIRQAGIKGISIATTEAIMQSSWNAQYANSSTPVAMLQLLVKFYQKSMLSQAGFECLWKMMVETPTGPNRIKGLLPADAVVAHKTGTSNTNSQGVTAGTNDVGIVMLPNGKSFVIVVFVSDSKEDEKIREAVIAAIAKASWDYFSAKSK